MTKRNLPVSPSERVFIGLGSNIGDRAATLQSAVDRLCEREDMECVRVSSLYESRAMVLPDAPSQPPYYNAVLEVRTSLSPPDLLRVLLDTERALGRQRSPGTRWQPRSIDLDILLYGTEMISTVDLTVPHPGLPERAFVLMPLAEIAPDVRIPSEGESAANLLARLSEETADRVPTIHLTMNNGEHA